MSDLHYDRRLLVRHGSLSLHFLIITASFVVLCQTWAMVFFGPVTDNEKRERIRDMYQGYKKSFPAVVDIEPKLTMDLMGKLKILFLDDREEQELSVSMLRGAIPAKLYLKNPKEYPADIIIAYCTISYRSGKLAEKLKQQGITIYNLEGGILAWVHDGGKIYDRNGETRRIHIYDPELDLAPKSYQPVL